MAKGGKSYEDYLEDISEEIERAARIVDAAQIFTEGLRDFVDSLMILHGTFSDKYMPKGFTIGFHLAMPGLKLGD